MFNTEKELQEYCYEVLKYRGIDYQAEVSVSERDGRADIVTADAVIELKKILTRESIHSAVGQALSYNATLQREKVIIMGCKPATDEALNSALVAIRLHTKAHPNLLYIKFWEDSEFWHLPQPEPQYREPVQYLSPRYYSDDFSGWGCVAIVGIAAIVLGGLAIGLGMNSGSTKSREGEDRKVTQAEVQHYAQIGRLSSGNGIEKNQDAIAQQYHQIANVTQVTCLKNFAQNMEAAAESSKLSQDGWNIFNRYMTGGCEPLKVLENLSGYRQQPVEAQVTQEKSLPLALNKPRQAPLKQVPNGGEAIVRSTRFNTNAAYIHLAPSFESAYSGKPLLNETRVKVLERRGKWTKVRARDCTGWVWSEYVFPVTPSAPK